MTKPFHFADAVIERSIERHSILVCGLDPVLSRIPKHLLSAAISAYGRTDEAVGRAFLAFNKFIIDKVDDAAVAFKPQIAFYEMYGSWGIWAHEGTIKHLRERDALVITDGKRNDGGPTADAYADGHVGAVPFWGPPDDPFNFGTVEGPLRVDALTVTPSIGDACIDPFVRRIQKFGTGVFVVMRTSFAPPSRIEALPIGEKGPFWQELAGMVTEWGAETMGRYGFGNVGVVFGATRPDDAPWVRQNLGSVLKLVPGYGAQGADEDDAIAATDAMGRGCLINSSRGIIFAGEGVDFAEAAGAAARKARDGLNAALTRAGKHPYE